MLTLIFPVGGTSRKNLLQALPQRRVHAHASAAPTAKQFQSRNCVTIGWYLSHFLVRWAMFEDARRKAKANVPEGCSTSSSLSYQSVPREHLRDTLTDPEGRYATFSCINVGDRNRHSQAVAPSTLPKHRQQGSAMPNALPSYPSVMSLRNIRAPGTANLPSCPFSGYQPPVTKPGVTMLRNPLRLDLPSSPSRTLQRNPSCNVDLRFLCLFQLVMGFLWATEWEARIPSSKVVIFNNRASSLFTRATRKHV